MSTAQEVYDKLSSTQKRVLRDWDTNRFYSVEADNPMVVGGRVVTKPTRQKLESLGLISVVNHRKGLTWGGLTWGVITYDLTPLGKEVRRL
jgi:hypothetical protein